MNFNGGLHLSYQGAVATLHRGKMSNIGVAV